MTVLASGFLVLALVLGVVVGPQMRAWSWGFALLSLGVAVLAAFPDLWKREARRAPAGMVGLGVAVVAWFGWRAWVSPVAELGMADLLLLSGAVGGFLVVRGMEGNHRAETVLLWGVALLLLSNVVVVALQVVDPTFAPVFRSPVVRNPSGFYAHYNEGANFLIGASFLLSGFALFGKQGGLTRLMWGAIAVAGIAAVYFTRSRGGLMAVAVAALVFLVGAMVVGKQRQARWFAPILIISPILGILAIWLLLKSWDAAQVARGGKEGVEEIIGGNFIRLYMIGIAMSCIALHPWTGGGSRSFSWESLQFWDKSSQGIFDRTPEQVHNELIQSATDYGLIGAALLVTLMATLIVLAVIRMVFVREEAHHPMTAWRLGGLVALAGMFVQSSFSFVFHLFPGVLLLGICLGGAAARKGPLGEKRPAGRSAMDWLKGLGLGVVSLFALALLLPWGWQASRITLALWNSSFGSPAQRAPSQRLPALSRAIELWPTAVFYQERAAIHQKLSSSPEGFDANSPPVQAALQDYAKAVKLHPYDAAIAVNYANLLSMADMDADATAHYQRAVRLQGGMETAFQANALYAGHLWRTGSKDFRNGSSESAQQRLEQAAESIERAVHLRSAWDIGPEARSLRVSIYESLGVVRESRNDWQAALADYDFAAGIYGGGHSHYRAARLLASRAEAAWQARRPGEALSGFLKARERVVLAKRLPHGVTLEERQDFLSYLDEKIAFLRGARIEPVEEP